MTQLARVIKASRSFRGVCQADFSASTTPDGGPKILRVGARVWEAEQQGYVFEIIGWRDKCKTFRLLKEPESVRAVASEDRPSFGDADLLTAAVNQAGVTVLTGSEAEEGSSMTILAEGVAASPAISESDSAGTAVPLSFVPETLFPVAPVSHYEAEWAA